MAKPKHLCAHAGCRTLIDYDLRFCDKHKQQRLTKTEGHARYLEHKHDGGKFFKFYRSKPWRKLSYSYRLDHPCCEWCLKQGKIVPVDVVDHITPIRVAWDKRLDDDNLQSLCHACHVLKTQDDIIKYHLTPLKEDPTK